MHKVFYASGFLYNLPTQQILLQQLGDSSSEWSLFGGKSNNVDSPSAVFQHIIHKQLSIKLIFKRIIPVYDYFHEVLGKNHFIVYAEVSKPRKNFTLRNGVSAEWFTFKQIQKLSLPIQVRQDIVVGQRVIDAAARSLYMPHGNSVLFNER